MIYNYVITLLFCLSSCASKKDLEESSGRWIIFLWHYYLKKIIQYCGYHKIKLSVLTGTRLVYLTSHYFFRTILLKDRYITVKVHLLLLVLVLLYTIMGNDLSVVNILNYINRIHGEYYNMTNLKEKKKNTEIVSPRDWYKSSVSVEIKSQKSYSSSFTRICHTLPL